MNILQPFQILPPFKDDSLFEEFLKDYFNEIEKTSSYALYGRNGQNQSGMDVISFEKSTIIQCKLHFINSKSDISIRKNLLKELQEDLNSFLEYIVENKIKINRFIFASTFKADTKIDDECFRLSQKHAINVEYWSWPRLLSSISSVVSEKYFYPFINAINEYYDFRGNVNLDLLSVAFNFKEQNQKSFIGLIQHTPYHINRSFRTNPILDIYSWNNPDNTTDINKLLTQSQSGIALLGNPGSGKTTELKHIALTLWDNREENNIISFYTSLKNFNSTSTISNILPKEFERIPALVIVFDGLDEVYDIIDFSNKLRTFIDNNIRGNAVNSIKFIISCRTTIYNKIVKNLDGFETAYLNPIVEGQAIRFLAQKFNIDFLNKHKDFNFWKYRDLLETPFYLELIGISYLKKGNIELSRSKLIAQYIASRLEKDEQDKFRNDIFSIEQHLEQSRILAFSMETMQLSAIDDSKTRAFLSDTSQLSKNPFIEQSIDKKWSFELKSIQEYLVAEMLSKMEIDKLLLLIQIDRDTRKVHPSWQNVVTLLLNIEFERKEVYLHLVDWLVANDIEIIFQADVELVSDEIRNSTLQSYFQAHCVEKTLWINNEGALGKFGDTPNNIEYLFKIAINKSLNLRARLSAIVLLEQMSLATEENSSKVENLLLQIMNEFKDNELDFLHIMERTLSLIKSTEKNKTNQSLEIAVLFTSKYDYKEFVHVILRLIDADNFKTYQGFILEILRKAIKEKNWNYKSKYGSVISTKEQIFNIFTQIEDAGTLLDLLEFLTQRLTHYELRGKYIEQFIKHCTAKLNTLTGNDKDRLINIIVNVVFSDNIYCMEENLLASLTKECLIDEEVFMRLLALEKEKNSNLLFLELIIKEEWYTNIVDLYYSQSLSDSFLINLRNRLHYINLSSAIKFQEYIENNTKFRFADRIEASKALERRDFRQNSVQREFDVKFDENLLKNQMENIFHHYDATELSYNDVDKFWDRYYDDFELEKNVSEYAKRFLWEILRDQYPEGQKLNIKDLDQVLVKNELARLEDIYYSLPKDNDVSIKVEEHQKDILSAWVFNNKNIISNFLNNPNRELSNEEGKTLTLVLDLIRHFKFSGFKEDFLLQLIEFVKYTYFDFNFIDELVDREKVKDKVLTELKATTYIDFKLPLLSYLKSQDISFDIDYFRVSDDVKESILNGQYDFAREVIELFYSSDVIFLKEVTNLFLKKEEDRYLLPFLLDKLILLGAYDFISVFLTNHYDLIINNKLLEESKAISYLIKINGELAFKKLKVIVINTKSNGGDTYYNDDYNSYSNPNSIETLIEIAEHCLSLQNYETVFNGWFKPLRMVSESLVSIGKNTDVEVCCKILDKIERINLFQDKRQNNVFYHEGLKNDIRNVIYKHKSKPFTLKQAIDFKIEYADIFY